MTEEQALQAEIDAELPEPNFTTESDGTRYNCWYLSSGHKLWMSNQQWRIDDRNMVVTYITEGQARDILSALLLLQEMTEAAVENATK